MAVTTEHYYTGNASTTSFAYTFPYYKTSDIKVTWDGVLKTEGSHYNVTGTNIVFTSGNVPANNVVIRIYRDTDVDTSKATFAAGSSIRATDLNNNELQLLYHAQEQQSSGRVNANISAKAEIDVSKLKDGTARQLIQTDAAGTAVEWTSNIDVPGTLDVTGATTLDSNLGVTGNITVSGTVDGRNVSTDGTKLDGIEAGATGDQTAAEIKSAYEGVSNTNAYTDAEKTKLAAIEASADVTDATNVNAAGAVMNSDLDGKGEILIGDGSGDPTALAVGTNNYVLTADSNEATGVKWAEATGSGGSDLTIQEEGSSLSTAATTLNFVGANVTASGSGATKTITITGGGEVTVQDEGSALSTAATTLNFVGAGVTASGTGATKTITISGSGGAAVTTDFQYLELKAHNNASGAFSAGSADYELVTKGTTTAISPSEAAALLISVAGVIQQPNTGTSIGSNDGFCIDGSSIHFGANLAAHPDFILYLKGAGSHTIDDNAITNAKMADDAVGIAELSATGTANNTTFLRGDNSWQVVDTTIADDSIGEAKLDIHNAPSGTDKYLKYTSNGMEWATAGSGTPEGTVILSTGESGTAKFLRVDGDGSCSWQVPPDTNTTYSVQDGELSQNNFTNADHTKLDGIATGATATPTTTRGDIIYRGASADERLAKGTAGQYLKQGANDPEWADVVGAVADGCIFENNQTISNNYTIASGKGAHSVGPLTVNATVTVNGVWVIS